MRAAVLTAHGQPPSAADHPDPRPGPGQAVVRMTAAPVVPLDLFHTMEAYFTWYPNGAPGEVAPA